MENREHVVKAWVTYSTAGSLHSGGLTNCELWFSKPMFFHATEFVEINEDDLPFGYDYKKRDGYQHRMGWYCQFNERGECGSVSVGKVLGYEGEISIYIWNKLCSHFGSDKLYEWMNKEREDGVRSEDFLLEIELRVSL